MKKIIINVFLFILSSTVCFAEIPVENLLNLPDLKSDSSSILLDFRYGHIQGNGASPWYSALGLGTPQQIQSYLMDTGTNFSWTTSSYCKTLASMKHTKFKVKKSSTYKAIGSHKNPEKFDFGPWGTLWAYEGEDTLTLTDSSRITTEIPSFKIYFATKYRGSEFRRLVQDAGMAFQCAFYNEKEKELDLLKVLKKSGIIDYEVVSFYADFEERFGSCLLGSIQYDYIKNKRFNIIKTDKGNDPDYKYEYYPEMWNMKTQKVMCNGDVIHTYFATAIDTGASKIKGDARIINKLKSAVTLNGTLPLTVYNSDNFKKYPDIVFFFNHCEYRIKPEDYFLKKKGDICWKLGLRGFDEGAENQLWIGSVFYNNKYTVFYRKTDELQYVGIADLEKETTNSMGVFQRIDYSTERITYYAVEDFSADNVYLKYERGGQSKEPFKYYLKHGPVTYKAGQPYSVIISLENDEFVTGFGDNYTIGEITNSMGNFTILDDGTEMMTFKANKNFNADEVTVQFYNSGSEWETYPLSNFLIESEQNVFKADKCYRIYLDITSQPYGAFITGVSGNATSPITQI